LTAEKEELEREKDRILREKRDAEEASLKRQEEIERLISEHRTVIEELAQAKAAKCEALVQIQVLQKHTFIVVCLALKLKLKPILTDYNYIMS
jgi:hypothetical protein